MLVRSLVYYSSLHAICLIDIQSILKSGAHNSINVCGMLCYEQRNTSAGSEGIARMLMSFIWK